MNEAELFQSIHTDLVHKATDPIKDQEEIAGVASLVYKAETYELFKGVDVEYNLDNNNLQLVNKMGKINTELLQQIIVVYMHHLLWKFPNNNIKPLLNLYNVPEEKVELVAWYILVIFVQVNRALGEMFRGNVELSKEYLTYLLTASPYLKNELLKLEDYLDAKYYFTDLVINFK